MTQVSSSWVNVGGSDKNCYFKNTWLMFLDFKGDISKYIEMKTTIHILKEGRKVWVEKNAFLIIIWEILLIKKSLCCTDGGILWNLYIYSEYIFDKHDSSTSKYVHKTEKCIVT